MWGIFGWPMDSTHKGPVMMQEFPCHDIITKFNSLAPGRYGFNFKCAIFNLVLLNGIYRSSYDNALRLMSWDLSEVAWRHQAITWTSVDPHLSPYGVIRAQWFKYFFQHLARTKWPAVSRSCSNEHTCIKIIVFWIKFEYEISSKFVLRLTKSQHWFR